MARAGRILQAHALELLEQELDALEAVAAVAEAGVGQEADHGLVDLHPLRALRPVRRDRTLGALGRDRARAVGQQQAEQDLVGEQLGLAGPATGECQAGQLGRGPGAQDLLGRHAAERARARAGRPGTEAPISVP